MNLDAGRNSLYKAFKNLQVRWTEVEKYWHDVVQKDFADKHWDPLEPRVIAVLSAADRLGQILSKARQECS